MKTFIKLGVLIGSILIVDGCSTHDVSDAVDNALVATSGNKSPKFFAFASPYRANGYIMQHKDFTFMMPLTKEKDWTKMDGWDGAYIYGGISVGVAKHREKTKGKMLGYGFNFFSSVGKYEAREISLENGTINYPKERVHKNGKVGNINVHTEYHGKENYLCVVAESYDKKRGIKAKSYRCYKFNPEKTMYKSVVTKLIYTKSPNLPAKYNSLSNEYTYQDLQNRAKRVLDSLYIKDGWRK